MIRMNSSDGMSPHGWLFSICLLLAVVCPAAAQEAQWIWSAQHRKDAVPQTSCYFRKSFRVRTVEAANITIAADDNYELFINGRPIGRGSSSRQLDKYDISRRLSRGNNLIAVKVTNRAGSTAGLVTRVMVKERGGQWQSFSTDESWRTNLSPLPLWNLPIYSDANWRPSQSFGKLGDTAPFDRPATVAADSPKDHKRFQINREFRIQRVLDDDATGSLIAMTFNEFGQIIASKEGGPLLLISDKNDDKVPDESAVYCDKVKSCQGILALNGEVYATGDGPDGAALYRLSASKPGGTLDRIKTLLKFKGELGEHGAHGLTLGPDGMIYIVVGNHSSPEQEYSAASPYRNYYEGDLLQPRYEDPGGHAVGIKAPGGVVIRTDLEGKTVELVAGGLRNAYDLAFNREGELFVQDSDMESDIGTSWYRPTRLYHIVPGGEYGWRSGWAKWPEYFIDGLPAVIDTGRGSPTGATVYNHHMFPARYHNALFLADWSEGRIVVARTKRSGASYDGNSEVFLQGEPLNVTDLEVGPDGALYFVTGGRGTGGGLYRITWRGEVPNKVTNLGNQLSTVIRYPQLHSAWGRQQIAALKIKLGDQWDKSIVGVAIAKTNPWQYRVRALDLMNLYGPAPKSALLARLAKDQNEEVRAKTAELLGIYGDESTQKTLVAMLEDSDRNVRRKACSALVRCGQTAPLAKLLDLLASDDRFEAFAARRLLEQVPVEGWRSTLLESSNHRLFIQGATALLAAHPTAANAQAVVDRFTVLMDEFVSDRDFVDMLRVVQLAMQRGGLEAGDVPTLRDKLADEFPSGNSTMNRELARLLGYLQVTSIADRYFDYLKSEDVSHTDKLHLAMQLRFIKSGWTSQQRIELLRFFAKAKDWKGGGSFSHYVMNASRDFAKSLSDEDAPSVLANGIEWPNAALGVLYKLPKKLDDETRQKLKQLDDALVGKEGTAFNRLKVGIVAVLARSDDPQSTKLLHEIWRRDPERRQAIAFGLCQSSPAGDNWPYLIRSLPVLEGKVAREVLKQLATVPLRPEEGEHYRQVILRGLALGDEGATDAVALLEHWTGTSRGDKEDDWKAKLKLWKKWLSDKHPSLPPAELPVADKNDKWKVDELLEYLTGEQLAKASPARGAAAFKKAQCANCHRFGDQGDSVGPDLSSISRRFTKKEVLQSILYPSHVISDQYASKQVLTATGKQYVGLVTPAGADEVVILQANGKKVTLMKDDIQETQPSRTSAMPSGLLNSLTLEEVADLFAYLLGKPEAQLAEKPIEIDRN